MIWEDMPRFRFKGQKGPIVPISGPDRERPASTAAHKASIAPIGNIPEHKKDGREVWAVNASGRLIGAYYNREHGRWYDTVGHTFQRPTHYLEIE